MLPTLDVEEGSITEPLPLAVLGLHGAVALFFAYVGASYLFGGEPGGALLYAFMTVTLLGIGVAVARIAARR